MASVAEWEQLGQRVSTDSGAVWWADLPATGQEDGPPLLVLHGFPTSSHDWSHVLPALRASRRVVLLDFLGFGLSDKPDRRYSIRLHADAAEAVAAAAGLTEVALVAHDMGDTVAGELLARDLEGELGFSVERTVLSNGSIYIELAQLTQGQIMLSEAPDARFDVATLGIDPAVGFRAGVAGTFAVPPDEAELDAMWELASRQDGHQLLARTIRYLEDRRAEERRFTGAIETHPRPVAAVWGRLDPVAVHAMTERLVAARPDVVVRTLEGVGHYPMVEAPDAFATALLAALHP